MDFRSDNTAPAHPAVLAALAAANQGPASAYGADAESEALSTALAHLFETKVWAYPVATGTAANSLTLAAMTPPWGAVLCHREAHIETDECGAPEAFSGGAKLVLIEGQGGKITPTALTEALGRNQRGIHSVLPSALSLTQATERGTVYTPAEVRALTAIARTAGLKIHMDGARFANALAYLGCSPADVTWRAGVDVLCFGGTKNGAMAAEVIVVFDESLAEGIERRRKRFGHLLCKQRFAAAQMGALLTGGLWLELAGRANTLARALGAAFGPAVLSPVEANAVFVQMPEPALTQLEQAGVQFYRWGSAGSGQARFVVRWDQPEEDITALAALIDAQVALRSM